MSGDRHIFYMKQSEKNGFIKNDTTIDLSIK